MTDLFNFLNFICLFIYLGGGHSFFFVFLKLSKKKYTKSETSITYIMRAANSHLILRTF